MVAEIDITLPGGPSHHLIGVAEAFSKLGHDVTVFVPRISKLQENLPFKIVYVPTINCCKLARPIYTLLLFFYLTFHILTRKCDLVYTRSSYYTIVSPVVNRAGNESDGKPLGTSPPLCKGIPAIAAACAACAVAAIAAKMKPTGGPPMEAPKRNDELTAGGVSIATCVMAAAFPMACSSLLFDLCNEPAVDRNFF